MPALKKVLVYDIRKMKVPPAIQQGELLINHPRFEDQRFVCEIFKIGNSDSDSRYCASGIYLLSIFILYPQLLFLPAKVLVISERICRAARRSCAMAAVV